ncbi:hypothetical protein SPACI_010920 [Sporomusa acidovorans DSM 3132]|uniref:Uncharacterized protein n=1 Tax=Sporomusa acidovorans (strain ATCC 49682 / DSM 3132 / Mol) TaxID=1123286 RepID=A0ABZ3IYC8_SPOA4|nr:hypothetical protein SPACI_40320 [Sporomusa acidovorans DSM 3132]SDF79095.1 hypothetical protein SAMN04488499_10845 [Sporomusa acidovorans]
MSCDTLGNVTSEIVTIKISKGDIYIALSISNDVFIRY